MTQQTQKIASINEVTLDYVTTSGQALHEAQKLAEAVDQEKRAAVKRASEVADMLVQHRLIDVGEKAAAVRQMSEHNGAINLVGTLVERITGIKQAYAKKAAVNASGTPVPDDSVPQQKQANVGGYYGDRRAGEGEIRPSDASLRALAGLPTG